MKWNFTKLTLLFRELEHQLLLVGSHFIGKHRNAQQKKFKNEVFFVKAMQMYSMRQSKNILVVASQQPTDNTVRFIFFVIYKRTSGFEKVSDHGTLGPRRYFCFQKDEERM